MTQYRCWITTTASTGTAKLGIIWREKPERPIHKSQKYRSRHPKLYFWTQDARGGRNTMH